MDLRTKRKNATSKSLLKVGIISEKDSEMDIRAAAAVEAAIKKLKVTGKQLQSMTPLLKKLI